MQRPLVLQTSVPAHSTTTELNLQVDHTCHIREFRLFEGGELLVTKVSWGREKGEAFTPQAPIPLTMAIKLGTTFVVGKVVKAGRRVTLECVNPHPLPIAVHLELIVQEF